MQHASFRTNQSVIGFMLDDTPKRVVSVTLSSLGCGRVARPYSSMIPLLRPIMAACVRSLAPNFDRMDLTRLLTVSSVMES